MDMEMDLGNDYITLTDEEGNELELEHLDTIEYAPPGGEKETYMAFIPAEISLDDSYELIILKIETEVNGEEALVTLDDEDLLADLFQIFSERLEESFDDQEGDEEEK